MSIHNTDEKYVVVYRFNGYSVEFIDKDYSHMVVTTNDINEAKQFSFKEAVQFVYNTNGCRMVHLSTALELSSAIITADKYEEYLESFHKEEE